MVVSYIKRKTPIGDGNSNDHCPNEGSSLSYKKKDPDRGRKLAGSSILTVDSNINIKRKTPIGDGNNHVKTLM